MASLYDYGVPNAVNSMVNLLDVVSQDKARKEQANHNRILQQKAMFEMDRLIKEEKKQSQKINMSGLILAQGAHPEDAKVIENIWEKSGLGQRGPLGEMIIERRNIAEAMKTVQDDPKNRLALAQTSFQRLQTQHNQLEEEQQKIIERNSTDYQNDKKYQDNLKKIQFIKQQAGLRYKQIEEAQMALDPKLRETMEEKALARQEKRDQFQQNLDYKRENDAENRRLRSDIAEQNNALRRDLKSMSGGSDGITPYQQLRTATDLRKEFNNRPEVKEFNQVMPKIASIDRALEESKGPNKVAADQAIITLFNKMTDPNSVVRESEYARTPENLATLNRLKGKVQKVMSGGAGLTDTDRQAIVSMAKQMKGAYQEVFNTVADEYTDHAIKMKVDPSLVIGERRKTQPSTVIKYNSKGERVQ